MNTGRESVRGALAALLVPGLAVAGEERVKLEGYADYRSGEYLIVDGQRVVAGIDK